VQSIIEAAVGETKPDLTLVLMVPVAVSEKRRRERQKLLLESPALTGEEASRLQHNASVRDRMEEADRSFFERVERGYQEICTRDHSRARSIDAEKEKDAVESSIWAEIQRIYPRLVSGE
jgi:thymidylate kinase